MNQVREIRAVLIGGRELGGREASGKSSVGNTILGRDAFPTDRRTACCQKAEGEVHGFKVTLVDTPAWWWHYSVENTPTFDKLEINQSVSLCPPGPHVFILILPVDSSFPDIYKLASDEHLEVFGKKVWKHVFVVFSTVTKPDDYSFENHMKKWPDLYLLLRKCKNRYHVLDIKNQSNRSQVSTLLSKIAKMVANEKGHYYETDTQLYVKLNERRRRAKERAQRRMTAIQRQRDELKTRILSGVHHQSDIRLVIVGASWAARSSAGNVVLGKDAFEVDESRTTVRCEVRSNEIHGRKVTVVDTPGWYYCSPLKETSEADKLEIKRSVTLCPPGPHAILLTVPIATAFNRAYKEAVETHMDLLGEEVWAYTVVLFTRGDWLGDTTIEERIETDEPHLKWLMNKCGNKYHVLTCKNHSDFTQSAEFFEKIDEMIAGNGGGHYKTENLSVEFEEKLMMVQSKAKTYRIKARRQRNVLRKVFKVEKSNLSEVRIVLLGKEKSGKSSSGNAILCDHSFQATIAEGFKTQSPAKQCTMNERRVAGYHISIVDTPGWSATSFENTKHILNSVSLCPPGPHAFLLVLSAKEPFTSEDRQALEEIMKHFGERVWKHTLLLFSHGDWLKDKPIEEYIECEGEALKWLLNKCESRYHLLQNFDWGDSSQVKHLLEKIKEMVVRNKGQPYISEEKKGLSIRELFAHPKTLTEEEWKKREEKLVQIMLEAFWMESDAEDSIVLYPKASGSYDGAYVPSMSGETMSDTDICKSMKPLSKVSKWLNAAQQCRDGSSSGYETESMAMSCNEIQEAGWMNFDAEDELRSPIQSLQQMGSYDNTHVPNMGGEAKWDAESGFTRRSQTKPSKWLKSEQQKYDTASSGYGTESWAMSYNRIQELSQEELNQDVRFKSTKEHYKQKPGTGQMSLDLFSRNVREQINSRRNSF